MSVLIDPGDKFHKLTVIEMVENGKTLFDRKYKCKCDCGNEVIVSERYLKKGVRKSCGCLRYGHGDSRRKYILGCESKLYKTWYGIKSRCFNPKSNNYNNYGGRGITMCDAWKNDYKAFEDWALSNGFNENGGRNCSIERLNVNGDYTPENCIWTTMKDQQNNTRRNTVVEYDGMKKTLAQWADYIGINYSTFMSRYSRNWSMKRIIETPVHEYGKKVV